jgi:hypothetical protein
VVDLQPPRLLGQRSAGLLLEKAFFGHLPMAVVEMQEDEA